MEWIKVKDRLPEDKRDSEGRPLPIIMRFTLQDGYKQHETLTANQIIDRFKWNVDKDRYEWLDESATVIQLNAAQVLAKFMWKNKFPIAIIEINNKGSLEVNQPKLLEYLINFQSFVFSCHKMT